MAAQVSVAEQRQRARTKRGPGKGLLEWIKLCRSFRSQQTNPNQLITYEELRKHNTEEDCWTAFRGKTTCLYVRMYSRSYVYSIYIH